MYKAMIEARRRETTKVYTASKDTRQISSFHYTTQWHKYIEGCDVEELRKLVVHPDNDDNQYMPLDQAIKTYVRRAIELLPAMPTLFKRWVNSPTE